MSVRKEGPGKDSPWQKSAPEGTGLSTKGKWPCRNLSTHQTFARGAARLAAGSGRCLCDLAPESDPRRSVASPLLATPQPQVTDPGKAYGTSLPRFGRGKSKRGVDPRSGLPPRPSRSPWRVHRAKFAHRAKPRRGLARKWIRGRCSVPNEYHSISIGMLYPGIAGVKTS